MKLTIDKNMMTRLTSWHDADIILDYDHAIGELLQPVDGCAIGTRYRLIAVAKGTVPELFDVTLDSNIGPIYFKKDGLMFLTHDLILTQRPDFRVQLSDSGSIIDSNVELIDLRTDKN